MESFRITSAGPRVHPLSGTVYVGGAKNSALKLMAASLLAPGTSVIRNVPDILDVEVMGQLLERLGCRVVISHPDVDPTQACTSGVAQIEVPEELSWEAPYELVRRLRASIAVLGPLVARCGRASVALPGGELEVRWDGPGHPVWMRGPAAFVFDGEIAEPATGAPTAATTRKS